MTFLVHLVLVGVTSRRTVGFPQAMRHFALYPRPDSLKSTYENGFQVVWSLLDSWQIFLHTVEMRSDLSAGDNLHVLFLFF